MIRAVIFDLDGVIADSEHFSGQADEIVLARYGIKMTEKEMKEAFGRRVEEIFEDLLRARKLKMSVPELVKEKDVVFEKLIKGNLKPIDNSLELIGFLQRKGFKIALATSSHFDKMVPELRELGIEDLFQVKISGDDVSKGKPDPQMFLLAAKRLGVKPHECAVIEDSAFGVQAAKNAGMYAVALRSPNSEGQDHSQADMVVDDLARVQEHIRNLKSRK
jgi:HAD superfamily hydrolase (TIGR01509 family)